jgi:DNA modification methylase
MEPFHQDKHTTLYLGDCREVLAKLPSESVNCCVTSPPYYGLRDYGVAGQIGLEQTPDAYVAEMVAVFREVRRVLREDGTLWLNLGDSYAGSAMTGGNGGINSKGGPDGFGQARQFDKPAMRHGLKPKDIIGIPWRVAFALQSDGWWLRQDIIWHKPNPMPESVTDRCTKAHEYIFLLSKADRYHYDAEAVSEEADPRNYRSNASYREVAPGQTRQGKLDAKRGEVACETRNRRSVWTVATQPFSGAHFATFPPKLIEPCVKAGCPEGGTVLDPFNGAGTTGVVAYQQGRKYIGIELNPSYAEMAKERIRTETRQAMLPFAT